METTIFKNKFLGDLLENVRKSYNNRFDDKIVMISQFNGVWLCSVEAHKFFDALDGRIYIDGDRIK